MKLLILLLLLLTSRGYGQSVEIQQLLVNIEKLAQMKASYQTMVNGYKTLSHGYQQVSDLTKGNFLLHKDYLDGLLAVSPSVRQYGRIQAMMQKHARLVDTYQINLLQLQSGGLLKASELQQFKIEAAALVQLSSAAIDEMIEVLTPGRMRMSDEERISVINRLDQEVQALFNQLQGIAKTYRNLFDQRLLRKKELHRMKLLHGIKP